MASSAARLGRHLPAVAAFVTTTSWTTSSSSRCEEAPANKDDKKPGFGMMPNEEGHFHDLFSKRQLWPPKVEYPLCDTNWDAGYPTSSRKEEEGRHRMCQLRKEVVTRHSIL